MGAGQQDQAQGPTPGSVLRARLVRLAVRRGAVAVPASVPRPPPPSLERVAATATSRAADRASGLVVTPDRVSARGVTLAELPELLPEQALIAVIEAAGERLGVLALCPSTLASLIEVQAIGRVTGRPPEVRRPTRADATLAADFVNLLLEEYGACVAPLPGQGALAGYRYASYLDDPRPLGLMLEDGGFRALQVDMLLGPGGDRRGVLLLAVPAGSDGEAPLRAAPAGVGARADARTNPAPGTGPTLVSAVSEADAAASADGSGLLSRAVLDAPVSVVGILCRRQISLRELRALRPGQTLALPRGALGDCVLATVLGQELARGRLGEHDGRHALRLHDMAAGQARRSAAGAAADRTVYRNTAPPSPPPAGLAPSAAPDDEAVWRDMADATEASPPSSSLDLSLPDEFRPSGEEGDVAAVLPMTMVVS